MTYCYVHDVQFYNDCPDCLIDWLLVCTRCQELSCVCESTFDDGEQSSENWHSLDETLAES